MFFSHNMITITKEQRIFWSVGVVITHCTKGGRNKLVISVVEIYTKSKISLTCVGNCALDWG